MAKRKKQHWIYNQSGVIPFRFVKNRLQVLLVTTRKRNYWIIPKGVVERTLSPAESAAKEAYEEAGLVGEVGWTPVGKFKHRKWGGVCTVIVFPMEVNEVLESWPEAAFRKRRWFAFEKACSKITSQKLAKLLKNSGDQLCR